MHTLSNTLLTVWLLSTLWDLMSATRIVRMDVCHDIRASGIGYQQEVCVQGVWYAVKGVSVDADGYQYVVYFVHFGPNYCYSPLIYEGLLIFTCVYVFDRLLLGKDTKKLKHHIAPAKNTVPYITSNEA